MSHDTHQHNTEKKPHFGPAVIMGLSFWLFAFFFLSLCNGKKEHGAHEAAAGHVAKTEHVEAVAETPKVEEAAVVAVDSVKAEVTDTVKTEVKAEEKK
ncbi:MAG: hypothetical protein IPG89_12610 [Bacteroidetes bacterium]|nr:hypothetical protein [Bacteroidota bacterium]